MLYVLRNTVLVGKPWYHTPQTSPNIAKRRQTYVLHAVTLLGRFSSTLTLSSLTCVRVYPQRRSGQGVVPREVPCRPRDVLFLYIPRRV